MLDFIERCECSKRAYLEVSDRTERSRSVKDSIK